MSSFQFAVQIINGYRGSLAPRSAEIWRLTRASLPTKLVRDRLGGTPSTASLLVIFGINLARTHIRVVKYALNRLNRARVTKNNGRSRDQ